MDTGANLIDFTTALYHLESNIGTHGHHDYPITSSHNQLPVSENHLKAYWKLYTNIMVILYYRYNRLLHTRHFRHSDGANIYVELYT